MKDKRKKEAQLFLREYNNNNNNVSSLILPPVAGAKLPMAPPPYISLIDAPQGYKKEKKGYLISFLFIITVRDSSCVPSAGFYMYI